MITVKASQKIFTYAEVANLTGIYVDHQQETSHERLSGSDEDFKEDFTQATLEVGSPHSSRCVAPTSTVGTMKAKFWLAMMDSSKSGVS